MGGGGGWILLLSHTQDTYTVFSGSDNFLDGVSVGGVGGGRTSLPNSYIHEVSCR